MKARIFSGILLAGPGFNPRGNIHAPGFQYTDRLRDICRVQAAGHNHVHVFADCFNPGSRRLPVEHSSRASRQFRRSRVNEECANAVLGALLCGESAVDFVRSQYPKDSQMRPLAVSFWTNSALPRRTAMQLHCSQACPCYRVQNPFNRFVYENADLFDPLWQSCGDLAHNFRISPARAFFIEHEPQRIRAGVDRRQRVFQIGNAANLDPSHGESSVFGRQSNLDLPQQACSFGSRNQKLETRNRGRGLVQQTP